MSGTRPVMVVGNGERPPDHLKNDAAGMELLGVDGGARWILRWGLVPDRVMGDLDSLDERTRTYTDGFGSPIVKTSGAGHRADLGRVIDQLIEEHPPSVTLTGCVGARLDHVLAAVFGMGRLALAGIPVRLVERWGTAWVAGPGHPAMLADLAAERAALFPLSPHVDGIVLSGFDLEENPASLAPPFDGLVGLPIVSDPAEVHVKSGALLVLVPRRENPDEGRPADAKRHPTYRLGTLQRTE